MHCDTLHLPRRGAPALALLSALAAFASAHASPAASDDYIFLDSFESSDCSQAPSCTAPQAGKACVAGQLFDAATTQPSRAMFNVGLACGEGAVGGPCDLALAAYDVLQFAASPQTATPLAGDPVVVDGCGRYRFTNLTPPSSVFVAIAAADGPGSDGHMESAALHALAANQQVVGVDVPVVLTSTVSAWSLLGQTDFSAGALLLGYSIAGMPAPGVVALRDGGSPGTVRYFSDTDSQRLFVSPDATSTGANGSALVAGATSGGYSGVGGESNGCHWSSAPATSAGGVIVFVTLVCQ